MKVLLGVGVAGLSGTFQGVTAQSWRGLQVFRKKPTPHQANTPRQTVVKALFGLLSSAWKNDLTQGLRQAWNNLAANRPWLDVFGREMKMTGENLYIKANIILLDAGRPRNDQPVPGTIPPDCTDLLFSGEEENLVIEVPGLDTGIITSQEPFLNITIAGYPEIVQHLTPPPSPNIEITTFGLSQGRTHQVSDFRHAVYADNVAIPEPPALGIIKIQLSGLIGTKRNIVVSAQRFNKYGNYSVPIINSRIGEIV